MTLKECWLALKIRAVLFGRLVGYMLSGLFSKLWAYFTGFLLMLGMIIGQLMELLSTRDKREKR